MKKPSFLPYFNRSQRRGILILLGLIFMVQLVIVFGDRFYKPQAVSYQIPAELQKEYDSLRQIALQKQQKKIYPFNPNYLTDYKGYYLGLNLEQIDRVLAFRKQGKYFQSKTQFKDVAGLSDSLFKALEPYIKIPVYKTYKSYKAGVTKISTTDINSTTAEDLQSINGIGQVLSARIIKFRNAIGGFTDKSQLNKVYGLEPDVVQRVWQKFKIVKNSKPVVAIVQKPVNTATAEDYKQVYGIGDKLAERIVKYRNKIGGFTIPEQLNDVYGLKPEVVANFWRYFKIEHPAKISLRINVNDANIKELSKNPNISYQLARKIISYRTLHGAFHTFDELLKVPDYPENRHKQICLYLSLDE